VDANIAVTQFTAAGVAVWAIQKLKQSPWFPMLKEDSQAWVKRVLSIATAIGIHTGIAGVWNHGEVPAGYSYQLIINIPSVTVILVTLWHWLGQYVMQEGWYQVAFNRLSLTSAPAGPTTPLAVTSQGEVVVPHS